MSPQFELELLRKKYSELENTENRMVYAKFGDETSQVRIFREPDGGFSFGFPMKQHRISYGLRFQTYHELMVYAWKILGCYL